MTFIREPIIENLNANIQAQENEKIKNFTKKRKILVKKENEANITGCKLNIYKTLLNMENQ
jgi:hypothetical protein